MRKVPSCGTALNCEDEARRPRPVHDHGGGPRIPSGESPDGLPADSAAEYPGHPGRAAVAVSTRGHRGLARNAAGNSGPTSYSSESSAIAAVNLDVARHVA